MVRLVNLFLTLLLAMLRRQAEPHNQDQPLANEECILMTDERVDEVREIMQELTDFIDLLTTKHKYFDMQVLKFSIEKYVEKKDEDKPTVLELNVNACGKISESYNFFDEFVAHRDLTKDVSIASNNSEVPTQGNESETNSNINTEDSITEHIKKTRYQIINKQDPQVGDIAPDNHMDQTTITSVINQHSTNYEETSVHTFLSNSSSLDTNGNHKSDQYFENTDNSNQETSRTVVNSEDSSVYNTVSTDNDPNNNSDRKTSSDAVFSERNTTTATNNISNKSTENMETNEQTESTITSSNNDQSTGSVDNSNGYTDTTSQTTNNNVFTDSSSQNTNTNAFTDSSSQTTNTNAYTDNSSQTTNYNADTENSPQFTNNNAHTDTLTQSRHYNNVNRDRTSQSKNKQNNQIENHVNGRYNTEIDKTFEENHFLKSLRQLIRREVIAASGTTDKNTENYYGTGIDDDRKYDGESSGKPQLVIIDLPDDVMRLKNYMDRKRGLNPSRNPMLVHIIKNSRGQQITIL